MNNIKLVSISVVSAIIVSVGAFLLLPRPSINERVVEREIVKEGLGAVSGPDIYSPYLNLNDVILFPASEGLNQASTTVCSFQSPNSTSSLLFASVQIDTPTT